MAVINELEERKKGTNVGNLKRTEAVEMEIKYERNDSNRNVKKRDRRAIKGDREPWEAKQ